MELVDNEDVKGMIVVFFFCQLEVLACIELYANIELNTLPTLNP